MDKSFLRMDGKLDVRMEGTLSEFKMKKGSKERIENKKKRGGTKDENNEIFS